MRWAVESASSRWPTGLILDADREPGCGPAGAALAKRYEAIMLRTRVARIDGAPGRPAGALRGRGPHPAKRSFYQLVLLAVGRSPNGKQLGADRAGVAVDEKGFIPVDRQRRTNVSHIFAIGDLVAGPMLAHKATHEGRVAAEAIAGFDARF